MGRLGKEGAIWWDSEGRSKKNQHIKERAKEEREQHDAPRDRGCGIWREEAAHDGEIPNKHALSWSAQRKRKNSSLNVSSERIQVRNIAKRLCFGLGEGANCITLANQAIAPVVRTHSWKLLCELGPLNAMGHHLHIGYLENGAWSPLCWQMLNASVLWVCNGTSCCCWNVAAMMLVERFEAGG